MCPDPKKGQVDVFSLVFVTFTNGHNFSFRTKEHSGVNAPRPTVSEIAKFLSILTPFLTGFKRNSADFENAINYV